MEIPASLQPLIDATRREVPSLLRQLQVGQVVQAQVLARLQTGLLRLQIGTSELLARSRVDIAPGTRLTLEVVKGRPMPELRILRAPTRRDQQQAAVRSAMRRQLPGAEVRQALAELRARPLDPRQAEHLRQLSVLLQETGVKGPRPTPTGLRRAVMRSGVFHEAGLAAGVAPDRVDSKARLLGLLSRLQTQTGPLPQTPNPVHEPPAEGRGPDPRATGGDALLGRLIRLIEGAVSRIQLQQAATLPVEDSPRQAWQLDLPVRLPDETHDLLLRIEREAVAHGPDTAPTWAVNLAFVFDTIGTLQCRIALSGERVSATFWCERAATHADTERRLPVLQADFEAQGLEVVHLSAALGDPPQPLVAVPIPDTLLDERA